MLFTCDSFASFFFFFQAEDGIRDRDVTGVQTCALPIYRGLRRVELEEAGTLLATAETSMMVLDAGLQRSEERRVGKECRSRGWWEDERKKRKNKAGRVIDMKLHSYTVIEL